MGLNRNCVQSIAAAPICAALLVLMASAHSGAQEKAIFTFSYAEGESPRAGLTIDAKGNLYGTTAFGGAHGGGAVFELSPEENGDWTEKTVYSFGAFLGDAREPLAGVVLDSEGRLYGTTFGGGKQTYGTVFRLTPHAVGGWTEEVLYSFDASTTDGASPWGGVVLDSKGNVYGTTYGGGTHGGGTFFELTAKATGEWTEKTLHSFTNTTPDDGYEPRGDLIFDKEGNLYGTTYSGGEFSLGTAFELSPEAGGSWKEKLIYSFGSSYTEPWNPQAGLVFDAKGNLYGTTNSGGSPCDSCGTVYELSPGADGKWTAKALHSFATGTKDGQSPEGSVVFDSQGNLYGTTFYGGADRHGIVFELTPGTAASWTEKVLHSFSEEDGYPLCGMVRDKAGNLYGTTSSGDGTIFEIENPHKAEAPPLEP
jgi:uncharacterized repeat protein (TIGR03803 family)